MNVNTSRIRLIVMREWSHRIRQRSFMITTAVMVVVALALVLAPVVVSAILGDDGGDADADTVLVINQTGSDTLVDELNDVASASGLAEAVVFQKGAGDLDPAEAISDGDADGVFTVARGDDETLEFTYTNDDGELDQTAVLAYSAAGEIAYHDDLIRAGMDADQVQQVRTAPQITVQSANGDDAAADDTEEGFRYVIAYVAALVMYMMVMMYGMWVAQGVVEEKSSRIMEIMINAASATELMFGKVIGIGMAGLTQVLPILLVAGVGLFSQKRLADALDVTGIELSGIDFGALSIKLVVFFLVYFLLGFIMYAAFYAGVGSLVSRQEDVSTMMTPMTFAVIAGFFGGLYTLSAPDSLVARIVTIFPLTSPMSMVPRILLGDPAPWEIALSIALLALTGYLAVVLAARIYRMGVLMYGQKPSLKVIFQRDRITAAR